MFLRVKARFLIISLSVHMAVIAAVTALALTFPLITAGYLMDVRLVSSDEKISGEKELHYTPELTGNTGKKKSIINVTNSREEIMEGDNFQEFALIPNDKITNRSLTNTSTELLNNYAARKAYNSSNIKSLSLNEINKIIEKNKFYPLTARKRGIEGVVTVSFLVDNNGTIRKIRVVQSSGYEILDDAAVSAVKKGSKYPVVEDEITVPIVYTLRD